jgi:hypothetical protein
MQTLYLFFITVPLTAVLLGLVYTIARNVGRLWLDHRVKLALLEKLESKPELLRSFDDLQNLLDDTPKYEAESIRIDYMLTGVILALIGVVCVIVAAPLGGRTPVGVYVGGVACVALGFLLAIVGLLTWFLSKAPLSRDGKIYPWYRRLFPRRDK